MRNHCASDTVHFWKKIVLFSTMACTLALAPVASAQSILLYDTSLEAFAGVKNLVQASAAAPPSGSQSTFDDPEVSSCLGLATPIFVSGSLVVNASANASALDPPTGNWASSDNSGTVDASFVGNTSMLEATIVAQMGAELNAQWGNPALSCSCCTRPKFGCLSTPSASASMFVFPHDNSDFLGCDETDDPVVSILKIPFTVTGTPGTFDWQRLKITHENTVILSNASSVGINSRWYIRRQTNPTGFEVLCEDDGTGDCNGNLFDSGYMIGAGTDITCAVITPGDYVLTLNVSDINMLANSNPCEGNCTIWGKIVSASAVASIKIEILPATCP